MDNQFNIALALPEVVLCALATGILLIEAFIKSKDSAVSYVLSLLSLVFVTVLTLVQWNSGVVGTTFYGQFTADPLAYLLKIFSYLAALVTFIYSRQYLIDRHMVKGGEYYVLSLFVLLGQMVMISASSMLMIYLGLELMSLALYALVAVRRDHLGSIESAMKYYILGSLASGFMLYGISMVYGATGALNLSDVAQVLAQGQVDQMAFILGIVFVVAGIAFKLGAVPFHMWIPDVYQGAPTAVTLTIASGPKLAAFAMALRLLVEAMSSMSLSWQPMLVVLAVLSLAIGNLTAIMQTNFKRMLAYSTISHVGFVLLGLLSGIADGQLATGAYGAALFYMVTYVLTTLVAFGVILILSRAGFESEEISDLAGLNRRNPLLAFAILILMFSLAGIPPMVGFYAKLVVLQAALAAGHVTLTIVAVLFSLIGAFYYLRVVKTMYFDEPATNAPEIGKQLSFRSGVLSINGLLILVLGILPGGLLTLCVQVIDASLKFPF
ncbi:NADH-quinone oxidoreductase subunit NuoN [Pelistega europaea]|uniref:NADH-quinone oxidoreductase subunit N n=1 Tax=Pelistega europaea TaxID=106147 RepID=A0A7Y4P4L3_9BURK|nr:NADH-quinone oxidoreductase subunit NuoN [Pelistega europaea]NOL50202.1 NADH-quinone oxidoreductase subunit NuoN [Pelistega europaea]